MTIPGHPCPRGRFAPTPSGPLHAGSLATALGSWLAARRVGGAWWLRFDDLDAPRNRPGAVARIEAQLIRHGLVPDGVALSSALGPRHAAAFEILRARGLVYPCDCTRARLRVHARPGPWGPVYDGHCRRHPPRGEGPWAWRFRLPPDTVVFADAALGEQRVAGEDLGDPVVRRADGITGYALACAVDEAALGITQVVRGADLLGATFAQIALFAALDRGPPVYAHLPIRHGPDGRKLSKQNHAPALAEGLETASLRDAAAHLGLRAPGLSSQPGADEPASLLACWLEDVRRDPPPWCPS